MIVAQLRGVIFDFLDTGEAEPDNWDEAHIALIDVSKWLGFQTDDEETATDYLLALQNEGPKIFLRAKD